MLAVGGAQYAERIEHRLHHRFRSDQRAGVRPRGGRATSVEPTLSAMIGFARSAARRANSTNAAPSRIPSR